MAYDVSVRQYLQGQGVNSNDIGYDKNSGNVTIRGQNFYKPELNTAGTTYSNQQSLDNAYKSYKSSLPVIQPNGVSTTGNQITTDQAVTQPVTTPNPVTTNTVSQPNTLQQQIADIMKQMNDARTQAPVDVYGTSQYAAAQAQQQKAAQQSTRSAQEVLGQSGFARSTNIADRAQHIQNDANDYLTTQIVPQIQAQLQAQEQQKQQDLQNQFNNLYQLSTQQDNQQYHKDDLANQVAQLTGNYNPSGKSVDQIQSEMDANSKSYATATPEQQKVLHDQNIELAKLLGKTYDSKTGTYSQGQGYVGTKTVAQQQLEQNNMKDMAILTGYLPNGQPTSAQQQQDLQNEWAVADQSGAITPKLASLYGIPAGTPTRQAKEFAASLAIQQQNANTSAYSASISAANQSLAQQRFDWDKNPDNPEYQYSLAKLDELKNGSSDAIKGELDGLYTGLTSGQINAYDANAEVDQRLKSGLIKSDEAVKMKAFIQNFLEESATKTGQTGQKLQVTNNDKLFTMDNPALEKAWETDPTGQKAGRAMYDWMKWIRDTTNGYKAGNSYELWHSKFGPTLSGG